MLINIEKQKEHFKNHIATFTNLGKIKILDFANPQSSHYRIRFLFEEDFYRLHISGDLGELTAINYRNMCYEYFSDFVHNTGYFEQKVVCHDRPFYEYDSKKAKEDLIERFNDYNLIPKYDFETEEELKNDKIDEILQDFDNKFGLGSKAYDLLNEIDCDCFEWIDLIGREETGILDLYMLAFELAQKQLYSQYNMFKCVNSFSVTAYNDDGFPLDINIQVKKDSVWEKDISNFKLIGSNDIIRLENEQHEWLEITETHLLDYFIPI